MSAASNRCVILSFSGRKNGNCAKIGRYIQSQTGGELFSFAELDVSPCGRCDYQCFAAGEACPYAGDDVRRLYEAVCKSSVAYYILPNYSDFPCANFFAFNERSLCFFSGRQDLLDVYERVPKKFIAVSGDECDNIRAALRQHSANEPDVLFLSANTYGQSSLQGDLILVPEVVARIDAFM